MVQEIAGGSLKTRITKATATLEPERTQYNKSGQISGTWFFESAMTTMNKKPTR
jgi:hypothetical protein